MTELEAYSDLFLVLLLSTIHTPSPYSQALDLLSIPPLDTPISVMQLGFLFGSVSSVVYRRLVRSELVGLAAVAIMAAVWISPVQVVCAKETVVVVTIWKESVTLHTQKLDSSSIRIVQPQ